MIEICLFHNTDVDYDELFFSQNSQTYNFCIYLFYNLFINLKIDVFFHSSKNRKMLMKHLHRFFN